MEELKKMCEKLEGCAMMELAKDKCDVDTHELGEVFDMIKDIKEAIYYGSITEAMEDAEYGGDYDYKGVTPKKAKYYTSRRRDSRGRYMYTEPMMADDMGEDYTKGGDTSMERYYNNGGMPSNRSGNMNHRYYTDSKIMKHWYEHKDMGDENMKLEGLEKDLKAISEELTSMVGEMSNAEKQMLRTKMQNIVQKI